MFLEELTNARKYGFGCVRCRNALEQWIARKCGWVRICKNLRLYAKIGLSAESILKSSVRTNEGSVMEPENRAQVVINQSKFNRIRIRARPKVSLRVRQTFQDLYVRARSLHRFNAARPQWKKILLAYRNIKSNLGKHSRHGRLPTAIGTTKCEAHFSKNSYGFRPNRSVEDAIANVYIWLQGLFR